MFANKRTAISVVILALLLGSSSARSLDDLQPAGLAVYTETARDIYVAGILLPSGTGLNNIYLAPGPKAMEYRIATRRISSRGFSGTLLLQGELGSGERAPTAAIAALADLKDHIKGALFQGDQFIIALTETDETVFYLNGTELMRRNDGDIFDFFFAGWVGESSSALLRSALLSGAIKKDTETRYASLQPGRERIALVEEWMAPPPAPKPAPVAEPTPAVDPVAEPEPMIASVAEPAATETTVAMAAATPAPTAAPEPTTASAPEPAPTPVEEPVPEPAIDDREYQRQLNAFVSEIMVAVFSEVVYPRRAIKRTLEGRVELLARMDSDGALLELLIDQSSGSSLLDEAAQKAVRKAAPFPELNTVAQEEFAADDGSYLMPIPVTFRLQ